MEPAVQIGLVRENLALAIALWGAAQKGVITAGFVPNRSEFVTADGQVVKVLTPLEVHDNKDLVRCVNNQVRGAFAFSAIQTNRILESVFGNSPIHADPSDLQAARCILYLLSKSVSRDLMAPSWVCPPEYRQRFGIQAVSFVVDASQLDGKQLYWDDFGGLTRYLDLLEYCSVEVTGLQAPSEGLTPQQDSPLNVPDVMVRDQPVPGDPWSGETTYELGEPETAPAPCVETSPVLASRNGHDHSDSIASFVENRCIVSADKMTIAKELYDAYLAWCREGGYEPVVQRSFGMRLTALGYQRRRRGRGRHWWLGIGLANS